MIRWIRARLAPIKKRGQGVVEYGLALGMIAVVVIAALSNTGVTVNSLLAKVAASLSTIHTSGSSR